MAAHRDALSGLGAGDIPAASRQGEEASPMARAQALLALTATPRTMPCRDNERAAISTFVEESLTSGLLALTLSACPCSQLFFTLNACPYSQCLPPPSLLTFLCIMLGSRMAMAEGL